MDLLRTVVVFDAADKTTESAFWAAMVDGRVFADATFDSIIDADGLWRMGVQLATDHVAPDWAAGEQQVHVDFHVTDAKAAHQQAVELGASVLQPGDLDAAEGHQVYASPAGHPFCIGWGHPSVRELSAIVAMDQSLPGSPSGR